MTRETELSMEDPDLLAKRIIALEALLNQSVVENEMLKKRIAELMTPQMIITSAGWEG